MSLIDAKTQKLLARQLERVLILEPNTASARLLTDLLRAIGAGEILVEASDEHWQATCHHFSPQIVFTELTGPNLDGLRFTRELRRSHLSCRKAPVVVVTAEATAAAIVASRNAGVHEFLRKPYTNKDLLRRLEAVSLRSREWVEAVAYVGPDRRRFNSGDYRGPRKRQADAAQPTEADRMTQALKIMKSAIAAIESEPVQALRSMQAQAAALRSLTNSGMGHHLADAVDRLESRLSAAVVDGKLSRADIESATADLWSFMPAEAPPSAASMVVA